MKLLDHTLKYLSVSLLLVIGAWAVVFYLNMIDEIYDSIDDGLKNQKLLIVEKASADPALLKKGSFGESNYAIKEIPLSRAVSMKDTYLDSLAYSRDEKDLEPVRVLLTAFEVDGKFYELQVMSSMVEEDDLIEDLVFALIGLYCALIIMVLLLNHVLLRKIWRPFYQVLAHLKTYRLGTNTAMEMSPTSVVEFRELKTAVDSLLVRSSIIYENQKQFTENAAHELQTPIAIAIGKLELLAESEGLDEMQMKETGEAIAALQRLSRLNKSLLQLARIENRQLGKNQPVSLNETARQQITHFSDLAAYKEVEVHFEGKAECTAVMDPELAGILIGNLLKNALVHNYSKGTVRVTVEGKCIRICNTSETGKLDEAKIFDRFYKAGGQSESTGLGLSIAKAIAQAYGFNLSYSYTGQHCMELCV